jgi:hypothetical protein
LCPAIESRFQLDARIENAYGKVFYAINDLVGGGLWVQKEIPLPLGTSPRKPSYVVLQYSSYRGLLSRDERQIELNFTDKGARTLVSMKWFYPTYDYQIQSLDKGMVRGLWARRAAEVRERTEHLMAEFKGRIGAQEIAEGEETETKEIIREKQVIVKIRCQYCSNLYDESLDKCPHCGGHT